MTKDVIVTIEGLQLDVESDVIKTIASGSYHLRNGKHYIQYDEKLEDGEDYSKNLIKITKNQVSLTKKMKYDTIMIFDINEITRTDYSTPYGVMPLDIRTKTIRLDEVKDEIKVFLTYSLSMEESHISDNAITISIKSKLI